LQEGKGDGNPNGDWNRFAPSGPIVDDQFRRRGRQKGLARIPEPSEYLLS